MRIEGMVRWIAVASVLAFLPACGDDSSGSDVTDVVDTLEATDDAADVAVVAEDGGTDADADADADAEADVGVDEASDGELDSDGGACTEGWLDPTTGYLWENPPSDTLRTWDAAVAYCDGLTLCGFGPGSWHLPTISELRSFIRGCPVTVTGGACGVTDSCLGSWCWTSPLCSDCFFGDGPGAGGCYWAPGISGTWDRNYWSSSLSPGPPTAVWGVYFNTGSVIIYDEGYSYSVRCVRRGP